MANYALLNMQNIVTEVFRGNDETDGNTNWEIFYQQKKIQVCKRTSYNTRGGVHLDGKEPFRKNYASVGYTYDESRDAFIPPKSYDSWTLNETSCLWEPPVAAPTDGQRYEWNEDDEQWDLIS